MGSWVVHHKVAPNAAVRLFCFPYAGGGASVYRGWSTDLEPSVDVCPVEFPGRETRFSEPRFTRIQALIPALASGLAPLLDRPFALFGHSLGAIVAFELARYLRDRGGAAPAHLFVSAHRAPEVPSREKTIHALPDADFLREIEALGGTPRAVLEHRELLELLVPILRADFELAETYRAAASPPLACPITAIGGMSDEHITKEDLVPWGAHTRDRFVVRMLRGGHFFLHEERTTLLTLLLRALVSPDVA